MSLMALQIFKSIGAPTRVEPASRVSNIMPETGEPEKVKSKFGPDFNVEISNKFPKELDDSEKDEVKELKKSDREVRAHEQAHLSVAGAYAKGGVNLEFTTGPDQKKYATAGHVEIDTSPVPNDPEATIAKAQTIRRAAQAPEEPSSADRSVAASAQKMEAEARKEVSEEGGASAFNRGESRIRGYGVVQNTKGLTLEVQA